MEDLKTTLNLPKTTFPMKAGLPQREPLMIEKWKGLYEALQKKNLGNQKFIMPDGPPYANGNIHIGHVLNKVLKDIVTKYKSMKGFSTPFIPGWDCHGLPIEQKVLSDLGSQAKTKSAHEIRTLCRKEANKWVEIQKNQFKRLGILADWENPYLTMHKEYEAEEIREFIRIFKNGLIYLGVKPVYWCIPLQTALAEAEVEYAQHKSPSIFVKFPLKEGVEKLGKFDKPLSIVIWTTTPWTLPANVAICLHPNFEYSFFDTGSEYLLLATKLSEFFQKESGLILKSQKGTWKGSEFENMKARHPWIERDSLIINGEHVTLDAGTGCVHTAPGHGQEDYQIGLKYHLKILSPVNPAGQFTSDVSEWAGMNIFKANPLIVEKLKEVGTLISCKEIEHSYPHCWRSKSPLIFRATPQWFLKMEEPSYHVRQKALNAINDVKFIPTTGEARLRSMIENRPDWTLSRQRFWGVPIPVFYCADCEEPLLNPEVMNRVADLMEKEDGIDSFWKHPEQDFVLNSHCLKCRGKNFKKGIDILDVWFDSGICHAAVQRRKNELGFPADIYLEGSDQHRGWFQTSLLSAIASYGQAPFKTLVTHGFVNDPQGYKMSKSLGNVVDPADVIKESGAEILRLWVASEDYRGDVGCGKNSFNQVIETYRRFRNSIRFILSNLFDFDDRTHQIPFENLNGLDRWMMTKLQLLIESIDQAYSHYEFNKVYHSLNHFFTVELSATYLDIIKDRLYTTRSDGLKRRSAQTVLFHLISTLSRLMAPILSFLAEESYEHLNISKKENSVFLTDFPKASTQCMDSQYLQKMNRILEMRSDVNKTLEKLRTEQIIGSGLEAHVKITAEGNDLAILRELNNLQEIFIVSQVTVIEGSYKIEAERAQGEKCARCWNYHSGVGANTKWPQICPRCVEALT